MRLWLPLCQSPLRHPGGCRLGPSAALTWHGVGRRALSLHLASRLADPLATCVRPYSGAGAPSQGLADVCPRVPNLAAMCGASKPALGDGGARVGGTLTRPAASRGCQWAAPIPLLAQSFRRADAAVLRHCGTLLRKPLESSPQHFLAAPGSARLRRGVLVLWPEHSVRGPTVRVGPKQGGWLQGRILTGRHTCRPVCAICGISRAVVLIQRPRHLLFLESQPAWSALPFSGCVVCWFRY